MPSANSSVVPLPLPSSTVITPSRPTRSIASAIRLPMVWSLLAEIAPTWAISVFDPTGFDAAADDHRVGAERNAPQPLVVDGAGEDRGGRRAVAGDVAGLRCDFVHELGPHGLIGG